MGQQVCHLPRMCADDHRDGVTGYSDGVRNDDVQRRPPGEFDQLFGLPQAGGSAGGENQDMWSRCHEVTGQSQPANTILARPWALSFDPWLSVRC